MKMGSGDLTHGNDNMVQKSDELGLLSDIFTETSKVLGGYINEISGVLENIASGNLDISIEKDFIGDFNQIKVDLNNIFLLDCYGEEGYSW